MQPVSHALKAAGYMIAALACFAAMSTAIRWTGQNLHSSQMVLVRNVMSLGLVVCWILARGRPQEFRTSRLRGHAIRATLGFLAMETWFHALTLMPLNQATALSFTTPVFGTLAAMWLLKEKAGWRRWAAIAVSFMGVLIILRPDVGGIGASAGIVLFSSCLMAIAGTVVKSLTRTEPPETIVFYLAIFMTPLSLPFGLVHWQPVSSEGWTGLFLIALFSTSAHLLSTRAYRLAEMVTLLPLDFTRLLFTALFAYVLFGETLDGHTLLGAAIILVSSVYIVHREAVRRKTG